MKEHWKAAQKAEVITALAELAWKSDHRVDWWQLQVTVLDYNTDGHKRLSLDACHITRQPMLLNRDRGMLQSVPAVYDHLTWSHVATLHYSLSEDPSALPYMHIREPSQHSSLHLPLSFSLATLWSVPYMPALFVTILCTDDGNCIAMETCFSYLDQWSKDLVMIYNLLTQNSSKLNLNMQ